MASLKYAESLSIIRSIRGELKKAIKRPDGRSDQLKDPSTEHMFKLLRANQLTEKRYCRPEDHYKYFAKTYLTYLKSSRQQAELVAKYFNKGESSVENSAKRVGLELPKQYQ